MVKSEGGGGLCCNGTERVVFSRPIEKLGFDERRDRGDGSGGGGGRSRVRCRDDKEDGDYTRKRNRYEPEGYGGSKEEPRSVDSAWDCVSYCLVVIRARGERLNRDSGSRCGAVVAGERRRRSEISESLRVEMEYDCDHAWYDRDEGSAVIDDASLEAEAAKRLFRRDGTRMSVAQSKRSAQWTADEDEMEGEIDDEDESKVTLLVHDTKPPFLDGRVVFTEQAEMVVPVKDPTSDMAVIARKGSALVRRIHQQQSLSKSRQRFWELAGSKIGDIIGVGKPAEGMDADTVVVGKYGEVDFKEDAKFSQHLKNAEAVGEFSEEKTIAEQRQYLPIYTVRDELLQRIRENQVVRETGSGKTTQLTQYLHEDGYNVRQSP